MEVLLKNLNIQPIFNGCMCQYFSTSKDKCSQAKNQVIKVIFDKSMDHFNTKKIISKTHLINQFVQYLRNVLLYFVRIEGMDNFYSFV